jgi:predicted RecB family nuclease
MLRASSRSLGLVMRLADGGLFVSASDLLAFLECGHLSALDLQVASGREAIEPTRTDSTELVARKGTEHELRYLQSLIECGLEVVSVPHIAGGNARFSEALQQTDAAMRAGADVIYQAALADGRWRGFADFLKRLETPSPAFGDWSYEVVDTKLARQPKPEFIVQLCLNSGLLERVQGTPPKLMHLVLGTSESRSFRLEEFAAFYRRLLGRYEERLEDQFSGSYPEPVTHCDLCRWSEHCQRRWETDDHLSLIAGLGRAQADRLTAAGITTCGRLAIADLTERPNRMGQRSFQRLQEQARLQVRERSTAEQVCELLPPEDGRGFARLPQPREGDLFFDMEGDPFYEGAGLEYLFGVTRMEHGKPVFRAFWALNRDEEKLAFEAFIDFVMDALAEDPLIHVYHYAAYELTALKRLMGRHSTREEQVDHLLRGKVLVDLYTVTTQALRTSKPGYSIKQIEAFYMDARDQEVTDAGDSIVRFEQWLDTEDRRLLESIEAYNEIDCLSTMKLRQWLLECRARAKDEFGIEIPWRPVPESHEPSPETAEAMSELGRLEQRLLEGLPGRLSENSDEQRARHLMAQLLHYHRREHKPAWWAYFERLEKSPEELVEDGEAIGELTVDPLSRPVVEKRSLIYELRFPAQEHKLAPGDAVRDPATEQGVSVVAVDDTDGVLRIRRAKSRASEPLPNALVPGGPYNTTEQQAALGRLADATVAAGVDGPGESGRCASCSAVASRGSPGTQPALRCRKARRGSRN